MLHNYIWKRVFPRLSKDLSARAHILHLYDNIRDALYYIYCQIRVERQGKHTIRDMLGNRCIGGVIGTMKARKGICQRVKIFPRHDIFIRKRLKYLIAAKAKDLLLNDDWKIGVIGFHILLNGVEANTVHMR